MKVLLDTNIIIDIALERQPYVTNSETVLAFVEQGQIEGYISASTISDLYYIIRKQKGRDLTIEFLQEILTFCQIATVNQAVISMAFTTNFKDFEDAIQYSTAVVNQLDAIITRNPQDFPVISPRILTPDQLIEELTNSL
ncbi:PIN domain-containing protein [Anabaena cylindrica FACHB-243]|uniref:PilT protein domain protein n=1 Tax=Anabaena cylindrica (strain ATCC 27899 / PCC 7122) TaxID=272123 RepID=K9ZML9_ANACC|nr:MULTISPECIES: PIN domain-containing protein [Anabaena]AFZ60039.1 PilT protein domain protein [Anabaena cylindrica PCC 7122]MBD2417905.1 PIN domain-containing protein [Anabaena cylindrica FACHB-243]MBY5282514.1 PIN domain-containing protein [Anabaena sp. CCAP 1446/1C]MBY5307451.1 PIN domain-containing protein [Anabaena sp. CCAP 1446/1C]MCM2404822.1 PIN domain-containing protein [Anabaena sp. CCAP 1446/1C]